MTKRFASGIMGLSWLLVLGACDFSEKSLTDGGAVDASGSAGDDGGQSTSGTSGAETVASSSTGPLSSSSVSGAAETVASSSTGPLSSSSVSGATDPGSDDGVVFCPGIACIDGLFLDVVHDDLRDGNYLIAVFAEPSVDVFWSCRVDVEDGSAVNASCSSAHTDRDGLSVILPVFEEGELRIEVSLDEQPIGSLVLEPEYEPLWPNDPLCGPVCLQARATIEATLPALVGCAVEGEVYAHGESTPDPFSCNSCLCTYGEVSSCTEIDCEEPCLEGMVPGRECAQCGPTDACEIVRTACLPACTEQGTCDDGLFCQDGACVTLCG